MAHTLSADSSVGSTIEALEAELPGLQKQQQALKDDLDAVTKRLEAVSTALSSLQLLSTGAVSPREAATAVAVAASVTESATGDAAVDEATEVSEEATATRAPATTRKAAIGRQRSGGKAKPATGRATKTAAKKTATAKKATKKAVAKAPKATKAATVKATKAPKTATKAAKPVAKAAEKAKESGTGSERATGLSDNVLAALRKAGRPMRASEVNEALGREETRTNVNSVRNTLERLRSTDRAQRSGRGLYEAAATS
ncbi:prephenate dehydrogenase [Streptomyces cucumeris]|uniref:prephenate dehydrogenase n=1 Tax=Streptomyces cucumeris TaxID=2962890 RepID=UPI003D74F460